uniref:VWFA domain-containing protein n=1 Tax=Parascaris univalens TaxID=6257 RepID=A0A915ALI6_PARUN
MQSVGRIGKIIKAHMELSLRVNFHTFGMFVLVCSSYEDFFNDMRTAVQELSALRDVDKEIKAILISTADMTNITGDSDICIVTDVGADNDHMVDAIANYIALATALCPTKTTTMASSTLTSIPPSIFTASTATETSTTETESSITSAASSGYTTVTLTTSATTAKPSSTPDAETTTSDLTVPSTTTATDGKTEPPPLPSPPCFGDFILVIDGSTDIPQWLKWAVKNITANWNFNDIRKLRVSAAASGLSELYDEYYIENFANTSNDWSNAFARIASALNIFSKGNVTSPK